MDEKTVRIALQIPEEMLEFLARLATREGFEARKTGRAIRWCIREEMKRQYDRDEAEHLREIAEEAELGPTPEQWAEMAKDRRQASESFPDDLPDET